MKKSLNILVLLLLTPVFTGAAELRLVKSTPTVRAGDTFIVGLFLDTQSEVINALEGSLTFSPNLKLDSIRLAGSVVPLWVSPPKEKERGFIEFAGILPGGYQGSGDANRNASRGNMFTLVFEALRGGTAGISFGSETAIYKNDGSGTHGSLVAHAISFPIRAPSGPARIDVVPKDITPPEEFTPVVSSGEPFGHSDQVLIFTAHDKDSGILRFDVARSYDSSASDKELSWQEATSPYVITKKDTDKYVFVRAVDNAGNTRVETIPPQAWSFARFMYEWWIVLVALTLIVILYSLPKWR